MFVNQTGVLLLFSLIALKISPSQAERNVNWKSIKKGTNKTNEREHKIVGGYRCSIKNFPFLVTLRHPNSPEHFCAASLLTEFWILTAFHCLDRRCDSTIEVIAGSTYAHDPKKNRNNEALQFSTIAQCYFYPIIDNIKFDIALARLEKPIQKKDNVAYVSLPFDLPNDNKSLVKICSNATVAGWGTQYASSIYQEPIYHPVPEYDPHLQCVQLPVISHEECNLRSYTTIETSNICTFKRMKDICYGDSGGPLLCNGYQYGIVSYGFGCAFNHFPGVYCNVLYFKNFIRTTMDAPFKKLRSSAKNIAADLSLVFLSILSLGIVRIY